MISNTAKFNERLLRTEMISCGISTDREFEIETTYRDFGQTFYVQMRSILYYEELESKVLQEHGCIATPKTWWDHFKLDCMPKWLVEIFPVKYDTKVIPEITAKFKAMYPDYKGIHPWGTPYVRFSEFKIGEETWKK